MSRIEFPGSQDALLAANFERPEGEMGATALFAHCFTCSKDYVAASRISKALAERGIGVLRFDFTGLGSSEGDFSNTNFSSNVQDLLAAADWLRTHERAPSLLIGHSLGGAAVLAAAADVPESDAVVTIGAPADPAHLKNLLGSNVDRIERDGQAEVSLAGRSFTIRKQLLDDVENRNHAEAIGSMKRALLVMHSVFDETVGMDQAVKIFMAAKHPKSFVSLDRADHLLTNRADAAYVADVIAAWSSRYLD